MAKLLTPGYPSPPHGYSLPTPCGQGIPVQPAFRVGIVGHFEGSLPVIALEALGEESLQPCCAVAAESPLLALSTCGAAHDGGAHGLVVSGKSASCADPQLLSCLEQLLDGGNS